MAREPPETTTNFLSQVKIQCNYFNQKSLYQNLRKQLKAGDNPFFVSKMVDALSMPNAGKIDTYVNLYFIKTLKHLGLTKINDKALELILKNNDLIPNALRLKSSSS